MAKQSFDTRATLADLEEQHRELKLQVALLEKRAFLAPSEHDKAADLKRRKLATKDAISALKGRSSLS